MIEQTILAALSLTAVACTQDRRASYRRWGPIFGLLSQPFWLHAAWGAQLWGMFVISFVYTLVWALGFWRQWLRPRWPEPTPRLFTRAEVCEIVERRLADDRRRRQRGW